MAEQWVKSKIDPTKINNNQQYEDGDGVPAESVNAAIEASWYAQDISETANSTSSSALIAANEAVSTANTSKIESSQALQTSNTALNNSNTAVSKIITAADIDKTGETSTQATYALNFTLQDGTVINATGEFVIPIVDINGMFVEIADTGQVTPSEDLAIGGFFLTEVTQ